MSISSRPLSGGPFSAFPSAGSPPEDPFTVTLSESVVTGDTLSTEAIWVLSERVRVGDTATAGANFLANLAEQVDCEDAVGVAWLALLTEAITAADTASAIRQQLAVLTETLIAAGLADGVRMAHADILEAAVLVDFVFQGIDADALETIEARDVIDATVRRLATLFEQVAVDDTATPALTMIAVCAEGVEVADAITSSAQLVADLHEGLVLYASIRLGGEDYRCFVLSMNPTGDGDQAAAVVEYENFAFDAFEDFGGRYFGGNEHGLFVLDEGTTDNGEPIDSWVRTAISNLGTGRAKRMPSMYLGYASSGALVLKAITTSETGEKVEDWYQLTPRPAGAMREGRIKLGRGLKSVYWGFELRAVGAPMELDVAEWFPMILDRRLT
jgi:hypothetical protein